MKKFSFTTSRGTTCKLDKWQACFVKRKFTVADYKKCKRNRESKLTSVDIFMVMKTKQTLSK